MFIIECDLHIINLFLILDPITFFQINLEIPANEILIFKMIVCYL